MTKPMRNRAHNQHCPSCGSKAYITTTRHVTDALTERYYRCGNNACGHCFKTITEITATVVPPLVDKTK